jgi:uncharacterized circularly permuted ATP-grasp superfamily protein
MDPVEHWHALLTEDAAGAQCAALEQRMRRDRLTFGGRVLCPFLRPFFLDANDEPRVADAAETLWHLGERVAAAAVADDAMLTDLALSEEEIRLVRLDPGYATASTAARADAFLLPDSLQFAEYNAESPAGVAYSHCLAQLFAETPVAQRFRESFDVRTYCTIDSILDALLASYREWGGRASPPAVAIVDWREVPTFTEFELLRDGFVAQGVPTVICDPRDLEFSGGRLRSHDQPIDLVYRRVLMNDIVARPNECTALVAAYEAGAVCVANSFRCKVAHKKAFFAVLTGDRWSHLFSDREKLVIRRHVPWTTLIREGRVGHNGVTLDLIPHLRNNRAQFVIKPNDEYGGSGVMLGWDVSEGEWDDAIGRALAERDRGWVAQERIAVRRETFPACTQDGVEMRDMLVDFAPYVFRGKLAGFLTRLSATGLANVTSGGGQVPAFLVTRKLNS